MRRPPKGPGLLVFSKGMSSCKVRSPQSDAALPALLQFPPPRWRTRSAHQLPRPCRRGSHLDARADVVDQRGGSAAKSRHSPLMRAATWPTGKAEPTASMFGEGGCGCPASNLSRDPQLSVVVGPATTFIHPAPPQTVRPLALQPEPVRDRAQHPRSIGARRIPSAASPINVLFKSPAELRLRLLARLEAIGGGERPAAQRRAAVLPQSGSAMSGVLTDSGREFCGTERHPARSTWRPTRSSAAPPGVGTPEANGFVGRFDGTVLQEFFRRCTASSARASRRCRPDAEKGPALSRSAGRR